VTSHLSHPASHRLYAITSLPPSPPSSPPLARCPASGAEQDGLGLTVPPFQHHNSPYTPDSTDTEPDSLPASAESRVSPQELASSLELAAEKRRSSLSAPTPSRSFRRNSGMRRSASKIPVREAPTPPTTILVTPPSRIPVSKAKRKSDGNAKATPIRLKGVEPPLVLKIEPPFSDEEGRDSAEESPVGESPVGEMSFIDSLAPTRVRGSESDSVTDSGFSVSPALSGAMSPCVDNSEKSCTAMDPKAEEDRIETPPPVPLERFSLVRRIQSTSCMERKSSVPQALPESDSADAGEFMPMDGMRTYRCFSDSTWRDRPPSRPPLMPCQSRIRLISSNSNLDETLPRLQSHHSSSEEEWFEQVCEVDTPDDKRLMQKRLPTHEEDETWAPDMTVAPMDACKEVEAEQWDPVKLALPEEEPEKISQASADKSRKESKCKACCSVM